MAKMTKVTTHNWKRGDVLRLTKHYLTNFGTSTKEADLRVVYLGDFPAPFDRENRPHAYAVVICQGARRNAGDGYWPVLDFFEVDESWPNHS